MHNNIPNLIGNPPNKAVRRFIGETLPDLTGFPRDRTDATLTVVGNVFTIAPVGASFTYWYQGKEVVKQAAESINILAVEGLQAIYYDETETLQIMSGFTVDLIYNEALVSIVYWDATNSAALYVADERHGRVMSAESHAHFHLILGTQWISGLALDGFVIGNGSLATHAQFGYTSGQIRDEDIELNNVADTAPAQISVFYKLGATGVWRRRTANDFPLIYSGDGSGYVGANGRVPINEFTGGNWVLTEVATNNDYVLVHYFATNDPQQPVIAIQGEVEYDNIGDAREGATTEINNIVTEGLPFAEFTPIGTVIFQTAAAYTNTPKARIVLTDLGDNYVDFRAFRLASTGSPGSHAVLGDLGFTASGHIGFQPVVYEDAGDPTVNDDLADTAGNGVFRTGYFWLNTTSGDLFISVDDTVGAAVWREVAIQLSSPTLSDLYLTDGGEVGITGDLRIIFDGTADDLIFRMSDAAAVSRVVFQDNTPAAVATIDSDGNGYFAKYLGIQVAAASRPLHVVGDDGQVATFPTISAKDWFVVENDGNANLSFVAGATNSSTFKFFANGGATFGGAIGYNHSTDALSMGSNGDSNDLVIDSNHYIGVNTASPGALHHILSIGPTVIGQIIEAAAGQTANMLEVNSNGGSGGDLAVITAAGYLGLGGNPATRIESAETVTLTAGLADGYSAALTLDPGYTGAFTVTRHNYIDVNRPATAGGAAITDAAVFRFDAAIGTHEALAASFDTTDSGTDTTTWAGGIIVNVNGTLYKIPLIAA